MGLLNGISAQAFTDNFLKTYMAIGEDERAKEATRIATEMAKAKLEEIAREKEMLAKMQAESTGFMSNPVQDVIPAQGQQMTGNFANSGLPAIQGNPGLMSTPTTQNYASEFERIKANGGNPDQELFDRQARIGMMYDPKTFMPLVGRQQTAQDKMLNALLLNAANNDTRRYGYDARSSDVSQTNDMRKVISENNNLTKEQIAKNHDLALKAIAALREKNGGKKTEYDKRYEDYVEQFNNDLKNGRYADFIKLKGRQPQKLSRYEFSLWYDKQNAGGKKSATQEALLDSLNDVGTTEPIPTWNPKTKKFE